MSRIDLVMFDLDGTLIDTRDDLAASVNVIRTREGLPPVGVERVVGWVGDGAPVLVARALGLPDAEAGRSARADRALALFREHYTAHMLDQARPYPGVPETIRRLRASRLTLAVVSNKPAAMCEGMLRGLDLAPLFVEVLGGDSLATKKPEPEPLLHVLRTCSVPPSRAMMVGDGAQDILAGRAAGVATAAALYGFRSRAELAPTKPDHWIETFGEIEAVLGI